MSISVIIPIYNTEQYLDDCLQSVLAQSERFNKIILVNDGSTDNSLEICHKYANLNPNILIISQNNQGQGAARNRGLNIVDSEYVMFLDSDDYLHHDTVKIVKEQLRIHNLDVLYFDSHIKIEVEGSFKNHYDRVGKIKDTVMSGDEYFSNYYPNSYVVSPCMVAFKTEFLKINDITFPEQLIYEDIFFSFKVMLQAKRVKYIPDKLYMRRYRANSTMTKASTLKECIHLYRVQSLCWSYILEIYTNVTERVRNSLRIYLIKTYLSIKRKMSEVVISEEDILNNEINKVAENFLNVWKRLFQDPNNLSLSVLSNICTLLQKIDREYDQELYSYFYDGDSSLQNSYVESYEKKLHEIISQLPLANQGARVGIFGTGYHTLKLLNWFQHFFGTINCDLYFIDSFKESFEDSFKGYSVININDADKYVDTIILSSIAYEEEMNTKVRNLYGDKINIIRFYDIEADDILVHK